MEVQNIHREESLFPHSLIDFLGDQTPPSVTAVGNGELVMTSARCSSRKEVTLADHLLKADPVRYARLAPKKNRRITPDEHGLSPAALSAGSGRL